VRAALKIQRAVVQGSVVVVVEVVAVVVVVVDVEVMPVHSVAVQGVSRKLLSHEYSQ
jgi:hypothetical protein